MKSPCDIVAFNASILKEVQLNLAITYLKGPTILIGGFPLLPM